MKKGDTKHSNIILNNPKNVRFREKLKEIASLIIEIKNKKSKNFQKTVKKFKNNENYEFNHPLIERYFLFKALQEVDQQLTKNNEGFSFDFSSKFHAFFEQ